MRNLSARFPFVLALVCGSFSVYCVQSAVQGSDPTAKADCGTPATPPAFTELASGIAQNPGTSEAIDVSAYREVVLQVTPSSKSCTLGAIRPSFRQADDEVFAYTGQDFQSSVGAPVAPGGRIRVDGPQLQLVFNGCALWRVVGVK
jgi:hypothetical protein